jgi:hypothetical protein
VHPLDHDLTAEPWPDTRAPWTLAGPPDPDYDDGARVAYHMLLIDPRLLSSFRLRFPEHANAGYDEMVRVLGYVWDCPEDGTANVTGHCCGRCRRSRADALASASPARP